MRVLSALGTAQNATASPTSFAATAGLAAHEPAPMRVRIVRFGLLRPAYPFVSK